MSAGNAKTGDDVGTSVWKQELEMELTGSHVHLKLQEDRSDELQCVFEPVSSRTSLYLSGFMGKSGSYDFCPSKDAAAFLLMKTFVPPWMEATGGLGITCTPTL